jgi:hypothetical protein
LLIISGLQSPSFLQYLRAMATSVAKKPLPGVKKPTFYELLFTLKRRAKYFFADILCFQHALQKNVKHNNKKAEFFSESSPNLTFNLHFPSSLGKKLTLTIYFITIFLPSII